MSNECGCECSCKSVGIVEEVDGYKQKQDVQVVNRDGDLFFIECPECHSTDVNATRLFGCRKCHARFTVYPEDGFKSFCVESEYGNVTASENMIRLIQLKPNDYFVKEELPRNRGQLADLKKAYPNLKVIVLSRDLHEGKDAHGHQKYKKFALIPLN